ncbi:uncharacterized protein RHO25_012833 [Cercospora beticola]|nr:hypothetical protein RHO25_012833 [Cercospora beticola]CAK1367964.1 unnamed protein product [Cercospora beticola]
MATTPNKTLAFFGATGGCAGTCLALALNAGYHSTALVRTPQKLKDVLKTKNVSEDTIGKYLTILEGNATDPAGIRRTIAPEDNGGRIVDIIINGVGAAPKLQWSLLKPVTIDQPTLCGDVTAAILKVARELSASSPASRKPLFINVSTTGIPSEGKPWDVPVKFTWLYHYVLQQPHEDKRRVQVLVKEDSKSEQSGIGSYVFVKPSLLMDGQALGLGKVRVGTEDQPEIGNTIRRDDVGRFMFERLVKEDLRTEWRNTSLTITY